MTGLAASGLGVGLGVGSEVGALVTGEMTPVASLKSIDFRGSPGRVAGVGVGGKMLRSEDAIEEGLAGVDGVLGPRRAASSAMLSPPNNASSLERR
ncbi:Uncharacterised protein [Mycobacteroides abscessus]|nr:Uncharacterised protein [Mycobacteroides abscessus]